MNQSDLPRLATSAICYRQIRDEGLLSGLQLQAYEILLERGPMTGAELDAAAVGHRGHLHKRLPELERRGLVRCLPPRTCQITGRLSHPWEALDTLPLEPRPRPTRLEREVERLAQAFVDSRRTWTGDEIA